MTETDQEFTDGLSPRVVVHGRESDVGLCPCGLPTTKCAEAQPCHGNWSNPAEADPKLAPDPRLPRQHTLDAHQLRVLHRAIDTLAFTVEEYRSVLPRGVTELIDATVGAWEPVKDELVAQTVRFQRGE